MTNINRDILIALRVIKVAGDTFEAHNRRLYGHCGRIILGTSGAVPFSKMRAYEVALGRDYEKVLRGSQTTVSRLLTEARQIALALDVVGAGLGEVTLYEETTAQKAESERFEDPIKYCVNHVLSFAKDNLHDADVRQCIYDAGKDSVFYTIYESAKMNDVDVCRNATSEFDGWGAW